jgi:cyanate lyase
MRVRGKTCADLAGELGHPRVWLTAAILGQHPVAAEDASRLVGELGLDEAVGVALVQIPNRGALDAPVPTDPTIYRLYEVLQVYGPAPKALIHEDFGDGIMSTINFSLRSSECPTRVATGSGSPWTASSALSVGLRVPACVHPATKNQPFLIAVRGVVARQAPEDENHARAGDGCGVGRLSAGRGT